MTAEEENAKLRARVKELEDCISETFGLSNTPNLAEFKQCVASLAADTHRFNFLTTMSGPLHVEDFGGSPDFYDWRRSVDKWMGEASDKPSTTNPDEREYICGYCLSVTASSSGPPKECEHCKIGYCRKCSARLKVGMRWCHGCGAIPPEVMARFCNTESTGSVYMMDAWAQDGLPRNQTFRYGISHGMRTPEPKTGDRMGIWLTKDGPDGQHFHERELSDEERVALGYPTRAESLANQAAYDAEHKPLRPDLAEGTYGRSMGNSEGT